MNSFLYVVVFFVSLVSLSMVSLSTAQPLRRDSKKSRSLFWSNDDSDGDGSVGIGLGTAWGQALEGTARQPELREEIAAGAILGSLFMVTPDRMTEFFLSSNNSERSELANAIKSFADELLSPNSTPE